MLAEIRSGNEFGFDPGLILQDDAFERDATEPAEFDDHLYWICAALLTSEEKYLELLRTAKPSATESARKNIRSGKTDNQAVSNRIIPYHCVSISGAHTLKITPKPSFVPL